MTSLLAALALAGGKPLTDVMDAERRLAADFSAGWFDNYRKLLSTEFRFVPMGGAKPFGRSEYIDSKTRYRNDLVTGKETVRLIRGDVKGDTVTVTIALRQATTFRDGPGVVRGGGEYFFRNLWQRTPMGYRLMTMTAIPKPEKKAR